MFSQNKGGFILCQFALIPYFLQNMRQMVQLVNILILIKVIVQPQHVTLKVRDEDF